MSHYYSEPGTELKERRLKEYKSFFINNFFPSENKSIKILDIGCGYGLFFETCKQSGFKNYEGVDTGEAYVSYATNTLGLKNIYQADAEEYLKSKKDTTYDVIVAFNVLEHIKKEKVQEFISLIYLRLKQNGMVILEMPNALSPLGIATFYSDITHEFAYTPKLLHHLLSLAGFEQVTVIPKYVNTNVVVRFFQKILAKIIGLDDKIYFSGNLVVLGKKESK
jgi:2-polyprenyl-3-methyl-5-hydroxy-6-metoxy-1,4-benzoquinol methylase